MFLVRAYQQFISPLGYPCCRYYPSCSTYAYESIDKFGSFKGLFLTFKRILSCHPLAKGGYDPVPHRFHLLKRKANVTTSPSNFHFNRALFVPSGSHNE